MRNATRGTRNNTAANRRRLAAAARRREARFAALLGRFAGTDARMLTVRDDEAGRGNAADGDCWDRVRLTCSRDTARRSAEAHEAAARHLEGAGR